MSNMSNQIMAELLRKLKRYQSMRDNELAEKNYSKAAAMDEIAHGIKLSMEIVDECLRNNNFREEAEDDVDVENVIEEDDRQEPSELDGDELTGETVGTVGSLFSTQSVDNQRIRTPVDRIAATVPPNNRSERSGAIKRREEQEVPEPFVEVQKNPRIKKFIADSNSFYEAVLSNKNKKSSVDIESITNPRQRAVAEEQRAMEESIGMPAYIVNEKYASLQINDLGISLPLNGPIDLSRYSAKKLYESRDLKSIVEKDMIKFVSPDEAAEIVAKAYGGVEEKEEKTFSSYKEAQRAIEDEDDDDESSRIDLEGNLDGPTEQEQIAGLINLTPQAPQGGTRKTVHGGAMKPSQPQQQHSDGKVSKQQHRSIRRVDD